MPCEPSDHLLVPGSPQLGADRPSRSVEGLTVDRRCSVRERQLTHVVRGDHVDVGVRDLVPGDDHPDTLRSEGDMLGLGDDTGHLEQVSRQICRGVDPVIDLLDGNDQRVPVGHRVDRHERHAPLVAPHERARDVTVDDAGEDRRHSSNVVTARPRRLGPVTDPVVETVAVREVDTLWTVPNAVTMVRLLCLPLFVWILFGLPSRQAAAWMLGFLGATDWVDGYLARRLGQTSEFGKKFDPTVDRLLFVVGIVAIMINDAIPTWFALAVLAREVVVGGSIAIATLVYGMERFDVTFLGKTATFLLMFAVPGFLMAESSIGIADAFWVAAWCFGIPGLILSYYTGIAYIPRIRDGVRAARR